MDEHEAHRRQLIWLNTWGVIPRESVCRLAAQLSSWLQLDRGCDLSSPAVELGVPETDLAKALDYRSLMVKVVDNELERVDAIGARILTLLDDGYPKTLRDLSLPPPVLYCRGRIPARPAVATVYSGVSQHGAAERPRVVGRLRLAHELSVAATPARTHRQP